MSAIHIALFKWKDGIDEAQVDEALSVVRNLRDKVPGIQSIFCGKNYHKASQGFTHGVVVVGDNPKALKEYREHPEHENVAVVIEEMAYDGIGFDFDDNCA